MNVLIAEDGAVDRRLLRTALAAYGYDVIEAEDGNEACRLPLGHDAPSLAVLNWRMPGLEDPEVRRRVREARPQAPMYLILLTARKERRDSV